LPWAVAGIVVGTFAFFTPLVNAPLLGVLTVRTPEALRPKVMSAVLTVVTIAGPLGFLAAGQALRFMSLSTFFIVLSTLVTLAALAFAAVLLRNRPRADVVSTPGLARP
jgi:predicted permease